MIPLRDNIPTRRFPVVTVLLIALNMVVFLYDRMTGHTEIVRVLTNRGVAEVEQFVGGLSQQYAMIPANVTQNFGLAWLTIFTSMFLHGGWLHLGGNMLSLWIFGNNVEDTLGRVRYLLFYLACGAVGAMAHIYTDPNSTIPTIGASGAVAGIMGGYLILFPHAQILTIVPIFIISTLMDVPAIVVIGLWALLQFFSANWLGGGGMLRGGGVAYMAHVGGFVAGVVLILLMGGQGLVRKHRREEYDGYYYYR
jgi:membrane associated rhomboid family serine protease